MRLPNTHDGGGGGGGGAKSPDTQRIVWRLHTWHGTVEFAQPLSKNSGRLNNCYFHTILAGWVLVGRGRGGLQELPHDFQQGIRYIFVRGCRTQFRISSPALLIQLRTHLKPPIMICKLATSCSLTFLPSGFYCEPSPICISSSLNLLLPLVYVDVKKKKESSTLTVDGCIVDPWDLCTTHIVKLDFGQTRVQWRFTTGKEHIVVKVLTLDRAECFSVCCTSIGAWLVFNGKQKSSTVTSLCEI